MVVWEISAWQASKTYKTNKNNLPKQIHIDGRVPTSTDDTLDKEVHKKKGEGLKRQRDTRVNLILSKWVGIINLILLFLTQNVFLICAQKQREFFYKKRSLIHYNKRCLMSEFTNYNEGDPVSKQNSSESRLWVNSLIIMKGTSE